MFAGFIGIDPASLAALDTHELVNADQMDPGWKDAWKQGASGVPLKTILELVKLLDLSRLPCVKGVRARLYYDAGADTVENMADQEPDTYLTLTREFVIRTGLEGITPSPKEVSSTIRSARALPKVVEY